MSEFFGFILMSVVVEGIISYITTIVVDKKIQWKMIASIVIGVLVAVGYNCDIFALFGIASQIPYLGAVLSGILIARGSNYIFDFLNKVLSYKTGASGDVSVSGE